MTTMTHQPVMDLIRASGDPASQTALWRRDSPACRVVRQAGYADADDGSMLRDFVDA